MARANGATSWIIAVSMVWHGGCRPNYTEQHVSSNETVDGGRPWDTTRAENCRAEVVSNAGPGHHYA